MCTWCVMIVYICTWCVMTVYMYMRDDFIISDVRKSGDVIRYFTISYSRIHYFSFTNTQFLEADIDEIACHHRTFVVIYMYKLSHLQHANSRWTGCVLFTSNYKHVAWKQMESHTYLQRIKTWQGSVVSENDLEHPMGVCIFTGRLIMMHNAITAIMTRFQSYKTIVLCY